MYNCIIMKIGPRLLGHAAILHIAVSTECPNSFTHICMCKYTIGTRLLGHTVFLPTAFLNRQQKSVFCLCFQSKDNANARFT